MSRGNSRKLRPVVDRPLLTNGKVDEWVLLQRLIEWVVSTSVFLPTYTLTAPMSFTFDCYNKVYSYSHCGGALVGRSVGASTRGRAPHGVVVVTS